MRILLHAEVVAPAVPKTIFDCDQELENIKGILVGFDPDQDAATLGKELGYYLPPDSDYNIPNQKNRQLYYDQEPEKSAHSHYRVLDHAQLSWIHENVTKYATDFRHSFTTPGRRLIGAHRDRTRDWVMLYLLDSGGEDHATVWYQETGHSEVVREAGYFINDYSKLTELSRRKLKTNTWTLLNAQVIHAVEGAPGMRRSLMLSLPKSPTDLVLKDAVYYNTETQKIEVDQ
jgi:hypothetical protein